MACNTHSLRAFLLGSAPFIAILLATQSVEANPKGGHVEAGQASIKTVAPGNLTVTQSTDKAIVNWDSFNIGKGETTRFVLPKTSSITLNRDFSGDPSQILGNLQSNGQLYLVNRNGILFGKNAKVDVAGLVASTHDIKSADFINGKLSFDVPGDPAASVINEGNITIADYGIGAFVAPHVRNDGAISARLGKVALASANGFTLDLYGDNLISFLVPNLNDVQLYDANSKPIAALVDNHGSITADGGQVYMTAAAARGVMNNVINTDGIVQANTVSRRGGKIILGGGSAGTVKVSGKVHARGNKSGEKGGTIIVTGETVLADKFAELDASGMSGGGKLLFGGDYHGGGATNAQVAKYGIIMEPSPIPNARQVILADGAKLAADALVDGNGGKVVVWSDDATISGATISARGGASSGNGGFIETSGKYIQVVKAADASAANGAAGTWLLDPISITIKDGASQDYQSTFPAAFDLTAGGAFPASLVPGGPYVGPTYYPTAIGSTLSTSVIEAALNSGSSVEVATSQGGDIYLNNDIVKSFGGDAIFALVSARNLWVQPGVDFSSKSGRLNIGLMALGGDIHAAGVGHFNLNGGGLGVIASGNIFISSNYSMPYSLAVFIKNELLGANRRHVDIAFGQDKIKFDYSSSVADVYPGGVSLNDRSTSNRSVFIAFGKLVAAHFYDRSVVGATDRRWEVANANASTVVSNALNGIPEIEGFSNVHWTQGNEPGIGLTPVIEVSRRVDGTTDSYIVTAPSGQAKLDAYLARGKPQSPERKVVEQASVPQKTPTTAQSKRKGPIITIPVDNKILARAQLIKNSINGGLKIEDLLSNLKLVLTEIKAAYALNDLRAVIKYGDALGLSTNDLSALEGNLAKGGVIAAVGFISDKLIDKYWNSPTIPKSIAKVWITGGLMSIASGDPAYIGIESFKQIANEYAGLVLDSKSREMSVLNFAITNLNYLAKSKANESSALYKTRELQVMNFFSGQEERNSSKDHPYRAGLSPAGVAARKIQIITELAKMKADQISGGYAVGSNWLKIISLSDNQGLVTYTNKVATVLQLDSWVPLSRANIYTGLEHANSTPSMIITK